MAGVSLDRGAEQALIGCGELRTKAHDGRGGNAVKKDKKKAPRVGRTPDLLRKSGPMRDRKKYKRKPKHKGGSNGPENKYP